jgi:hypothetical protein
MVKFVTRFMNKAARQTAVFVGSGGFRLPRRLTAFGGARNIIRIRTRWRTATDTTGSLPQLG